MTALPNASDQALLLVSFSMPPKLLVSLIEQAQDWQIPVVMRGLIEGDIQKTMQAIQKLNVNSKEPGVVINPLWFKQFNVEKVPALIITKRPNNCHSQTICFEQPFDVIYGNINIKKGLEILAEKGQCKDIAKSMLKRNING